MRADGTLVPFAAEVDGAWRAAWPEAANAAPDAAADMDTLPSVWRELGTAVPREWRVSLFDGRSATVRLRAARWSESHCERLPVLISDLPPAAVEPHTFPVDVVGIASRGPAVQVSPVVAVPKTDPRYREAERLVAGSFDDVEQREFERQRTLIPLEPLPSRSEPAMLQRLYSSPSASAAYIVAAKRYVGGGGEPRRTVMAGWLVGAGENARLVGASVFFTDEDEKDVIVERPLAVMTAGRTAVWIGQTLGYESEAYVLFTLGSSGAQPLFGFHVGAC